MIEKVCLFCNELFKHYLCFTVGQASQFRIEDPTEDVSAGVPFSVRLSVLDACGNPVQPKPDLRPLVTMSDNEE